MLTKKIIIATFKSNFFLNEVLTLLSESGYSVKILKSLEEINKRVNSKIILFVDLTSKEYFEDIKKIKRIKNKNLSIVIFSSAKFSLDELFGEVQIIGIPFVFSDLLRILEQIKKNDDTLKKQPRIGEFLFNSNRSILISEKDERIVLTELENKFLNYLIIKRKGSTKNEILTKVWGHSKPLDTHTLESLIYRLRKKIEENPNKPKYLVQRKNKYLLNIKFS